MSFMVIPTWSVTINGDMTYRVPETNLDAFLRVLTFNKVEFDVRREPEGQSLGITQEVSSEDES